MPVKLVMDLENPIKRHPSAFSGDTGVLYCRREARAGTMATMTTQQCLVVAITLAGLLQTCAGSAVGPGHRAKRSATCKDKYRQVTGHSACIASSSQVSESGISDADKTLIVTQHNSHRNSVTPQATNMLKMSWDDEIASIAQHWAEACLLKHDSNDQRAIPGSMNVGQNIASGTQNWTHAVTLWHDEVDDFTFGGNNSFGSVGHYTQLVWADTQKIGCGYAMCGATSFYVCNYGPAGNVGGFNMPYKNGTTNECSVEHKDGNLCDCNVTCLNGASVSRDDCTCVCKVYPFYTGDNCQLECNKAEKDPDTCNTAYGDYACSIIAVDCPNKCHVCPYAGIHYTEGNKQGRLTGDLVLATGMVALAWIRNLYL
ncbi:cysteine-rich venom protein ophanin-like isoform X1 [Haliotis rufescens]|uniref:cysteine-rich venom protein ophanin-like isoform X1 n=1 Tax=Haliotis rufescens TaxID=6454 RepID=UPI00201E9A77|nr:cysteine-rich venom protein ophanin-like isoform X1 [Haliotis rufescens]